MVADISRGPHFFWCSPSPDSPPILVVKVVSWQTEVVYQIFDTISSFAARGYWKFVGKFPYRGKILGCMSPESDQTKNLKATYRRVQTVRISLKKLQTSRPWGTNLWPKFEIFTVLRAVFPHFCPDKREIWYDGADLWSAPPCQILRLSGATCRPCAAKTPLLDHWVKTIAAWRSAGLLVITRIWLPGRRKLQSVFVMRDSGDVFCRFDVCHY